MRTFFPLGSFRRNECSYVNCIELDKKALALELYRSEIGLISRKIYSAEFTLEMAACYIGYNSYIYAHHP